MSSAVARHFAAVRRRACVVAALCGSLFFAAACAAAGTAKRDFSVDDLLALQDVLSVRPSPDGRLVAAVVKRASTAREIYGRDRLYDRDHADVWIIGPHGTKNITDGVADGSGWWGPVWSPDSMTLAMVSTRGGDNVRAYAWSRRTERITRLSDRGIDLAANAGGAESIMDPKPVAWLDNEHVIAPLLAAGAMPELFTTGREGTRFITSAWEKMRTGAEPSASALDTQSLQTTSAVSSAPPADGAALTLIDVRSGDAQTLIEGRFTAVMPAPSRRYVAVVAITNELVGPQSADGSITFAGVSSFAIGSAGGYRHRLGLYDLGTKRLHWFDEVGEPRAYPSEYGLTPQDSTPQWSEDGGTLAVIGRSPSGARSSSHLFAIDARRATAAALDTHLRADKFVWAGARLIARQADDRENGAARHSWTVMYGPGRGTRLDRQFARAPEELVYIARRDELLAISDGHLWTVNPANGRRSSVNGDRAYSAVAWPLDMARRSTAVEQVVLSSTDEQGVRSLTRAYVDRGAWRVALIAAPSRSAELLDYIPDPWQALFRDHASSGTFLWRVAERGGDRMLTLNSSLADVADVECRTIAYDSLKGQPLQALVILPSRYQAGRRYPVITDIYPRTMIRTDDPRACALKNDAYWLNRLQYTSAGYVVLVPSLPWSTDPGPIDPMLEVKNGVLPAVDRLIALGIADPDRLGLRGHSMGGFSALSLITQTDRFKAAVVSGAYSDLVSSYLQMSGTLRYREEAQRFRYNMMAEMEAPIAVLRMKYPPWVDYDRYVRNSPIRHLDEVHTPVLLLHGDLDMISLNNAEKVFDGLDRLGKPARLVRYWGEAHNFQSPANIRDVWRRTREWFDRYLQVPTPLAPAGLDK